MIDVIELLANENIEVLKSQIKFREDYMSELKSTLLRMALINEIKILKQKVSILEGTF